MSRLRFAVYSSSLGEYFFSEIRQLLACGLREAGYDVVEADERRGFIKGAQYHVVVGAQQFFYLGAGNGLRTNPWPSGVILYNTEQAASAWYPSLRKLVPRAQAVWEMPLGWVGDCDLFQPVDRLPQLTLTRPWRSTPCPGADWAQRPLDLLFVGCRVPRREKFFASLPRRRGLVRLLGDERVQRHGGRAPLFTRALLGLAQRAKVVLNVHRHETPYFPWHRLGLHGIGQGALVLTETVDAAAPFKAGRDFAEAPLADLPEALEYYLDSEQGRREGARIAARGLATYRNEVRLSRLLASAVAALEVPEAVLRA